ncbi:Response regulator receiver domain-containing protein [Jhaorihella thermophila]|uniref:Response regulator receiver domain-containing protein n=1 Tax=Jhaorihella thermophila TaxID=488547 RepID=A0A1H5T8S1_9RHOB|nr:Response regulator receiver domain-containing protein [Jhaorihella thermophila]
MICDIRLPDGDGEDLFNRLMETTTPPPFLFITGHGGVEKAVRLMQAGAADYITKPFEMAVFLDRLTLLLNASGDQDMPPLLGISPAARRVEEMAERAARIDRAVLIRGGPGSGKELVARRIHERSDRRAAPFVVVNLAREPDVQAAMFGPGGAIERTGEGVLFLRALSRMPGQAQQALADVLDAALPAGSLPPVAMTWTRWCSPAASMPICSIDSTWWNCRSRHCRNAPRMPSG